MANKHKKGGTLSIDDIDSIIEAFAADFEDGIFDGKGSDNNAITIGSGTNQVTFSNTPLTTTLLPAILSYVREGGKISAGRANTSTVNLSSTQLANQITSQTQFIDNAPITSTITTGTGVGTTTGTGAGTTTGTGAGTTTGTGAGTTTGTGAGTTTGTGAGTMTGTGVGTTTATDAIALDKAALTITFGGADSAVSVTQNLTLSATGSSGTTITWASSNVGVIATNGTVTRPAFPTGDVAVILTATISKSGGTNDTKVFNLTVIKAPQTANEAILAYKATLAITYGGSDSAGSVTLNLTLANSGSSGTTITWASTNTGVMELLRDRLVQMLV
ncbi:MAG: hypothetical protein KBF93_02475 [Leptospiraceae bacterium]|nr:hypothetical protein [Leptospiraceae bacterium]